MTRRDEHEFISVVLGRWSVNSNTSCSILNNCRAQAAINHAFFWL